MLNAYSTCLGPITGTPGGELACVENVNEYFYECFNHGNLFQCFFNKTTQSVCLDLRPQMTLCWRAPPSCVFTGRSNVFRYSRSRLSHSKSLKNDVLERIIAFIYSYIACHTSDAVYFHLFVLNCVVSCKKIVGIPFSNVYLLKYSYVKEI